MKTKRCPHGFLRSREIKCRNCDRIEQRAIKAKAPAVRAGARFGKLVCVDIANPGVQAQAWRCVCDCKAVVVIARVSLLKSHRLGHVSACPDCRAHRPISPDEAPELAFPEPELPRPRRIRRDHLSAFRLPGATMFDTLSVITLVAARFKITVTELRGDDKQQHFCQPRMAVYWLLVRHSLMSLVSIARTLGKRDHSTVINGLRRCAALREKDTWYREQVDGIERELEAKAKGEAAA